MSKKILCGGAFPPKSNRLIISWSLLTSCNYSCPYCYIHTNEICSNNIIDKTINAISKIKNKTINITLFGGEPTLHPQIKYIVDALSKIDNISKIFIYTNLSTDKSLLEYLIYKNCYIVSSFHPSMCSEKEYIDKVDFIHKHNPEILSIINIMPPYNNSETLQTFLQEHNIPHRLSYIFNDGRKEALTCLMYERKSNVKSLIDTQIVYEDSKKNMTLNEYLFFSKNEYKNYICYGGVVYIFIDHKGNLYRCNNETISNNSYGSIFDDTIIGKPYHCPYSICSCSAFIPKEIEYGLCDKLLDDTMNEDCII